MEQIPLVCRLVKTLADNLSIPVTCKIRIFPGDIAPTIAYAKALEAAGCSLLAIHPRTRTQKEEILADWEKIRAIKQSINIPLFVNGDLWHAEDVRLSLSALCSTLSSALCSAFSSALSSGPLSLLLCCILLCRCVSAANSRGPMAT
jgi:tRNA-dihydrouridine synthase 1